MIIKMSPKVGQVLQGYFRVEQFRSTGHKAIGIPSLPSGRSTPLPPRPELLSALMRSMAVQSKPASSASSVPRPDLLPAKLRGVVGQPRSEREAGLPWSRAARPELLPGMGPAVPRLARAQPRRQRLAAVPTRPRPAPVAVRQGCAVAPCGHSYAGQLDFYTREPISASLRGLHPGDRQPLPWACERNPGRGAPPSSGRRVATRIALHVTTN
jgi:hypothetical protein